MRKPVFEKEKIAKLHQDIMVLKTRVLDEINKRLEERTKSKTPLRSDDSIFEPFIDVIALTMGQEMFSYVMDIGKLILNEVMDFEATQHMLLNKSHLYSALSFLAIYKNDAINAVIYWEISQKEEAILAGQSHTSDTSVDNIEDNFTALSSPLKETLKKNALYKKLLAGYPLFIKPFSEILQSLTNLDKLSYLSSGIRNVLISWWIETNFSITSPKLFGQELVNALCILNESILKDYPEVSVAISRKRDQQIGRMLSDALPQINSQVTIVLGKPAGGPTGLYTVYPMTDIATFNNNYPIVLGRIESLTLSGNEEKAHILLVIHALRNQSLHDYDENLCYISNPDLFISTIGVLFAGVSLMKNLK